LARQQQNYYAKIYDQKYCCFSGFPDNYDPNKADLGIYTAETLPQNATISEAKPDRVIAKVRVKVRRVRQNGSKYISSVFVRVSTDKLGSIINNPKQLTFPDCVVLGATLSVKRYR
jgi:hypothetical protein